jgi:hypothetical protein
MPKYNWRKHRLNYEYEYPGYRIENIVVDEAVSSGTIFVSTGGGTATTWQITNIGTPSADNQITIAEVE